MTGLAALPVPVPEVVADDLVYVLALAAVFVAARAFGWWWWRRR